VSGLLGMRRLRGSVVPLVGVLFLMVVSSFGSNAVGAATTRPTATKQPTTTKARKKATPTTTTAPTTTTLVATSIVPSEPVKELLVAAASDLRPAFEELGKAFTTQTGTKVTFSFGSSGQLAQQIINGAPFDVFASADIGYVNDVLAARIGDPSTKATYAFGRLALWVPGRTERRIFNVLDLSDASLFKRIAIANPEHAPYGVAAVQVLKSAKIFELVSDRLVYGENVSDAYRLATSGNADAALISLSLVIANNNGGRYVVVPAEAHAPLEQALVVTAAKGRALSAKAFVASVSSPAGRETMRKFGFLLPGDPRPSNGND
jgi:molybdate transport system substrate-binding protein